MLFKFLSAWLQQIFVWSIAAYFDQEFIYNFTSLRPRTQLEDMIASLRKVLRPWCSRCVPKPASNYMSKVIMYTKSWKLTKHFVNFAFNRKNIIFCLVHSWFVVVYHIFVFSLSVSFLFYIMFLWSCFCLNHTLIMINDPSGKSFMS